LLSFLLLLCHADVVDLIFAMDTSGSMDGYNVAACNAMNQIVADLSAAGVTVNTKMWAINSPYGTATCLSGNVKTELGDRAGNGICPISYTYDESWATASAVVAEKYNWTPGAIRVVVPVSDECPCYGNGCDDLDNPAIQNAITVAKQNQVCVAPLIAGSYSKVWDYAEQLGTGTGCLAFKVGSSSGMSQAILNLIQTVITTYPPVAQCTDQEITVSSSDCKGHGVNINLNAVEPDLVYTFSHNGPLDIGSYTVMMNVSRPLDGKWSTCTATVNVVDSNPACTLCLNPLLIQPLNVSFTQNISTHVDKDYLFVTLKGPNVLNREYLNYAIEQNVLNNAGYSQGLCDYDVNGVTPPHAEWSFWQEDCTDVWQGKFKWSDLVKCKMSVSQPAGTGTQVITFKLYALFRDHFPFGYSQSDQPRLVERKFEVEVILNNFVTSSISFKIHAPPEVLNAIIQERYDVARQVYEIDVVKIVQSHFTITALAFYATSSFPATLVKDVYGDGSTDRIEVATPPPCSIPSTFRIAYDIRCNGMICRNNTWNYDEVIFAVPEDEMCPSVTKTYSPSMNLLLCADANCVAQTSDHILGYVMTVKAIVTMEAPILKTQFFSVGFTYNSISKYAKLGLVVTPFGQFIGYVDTEGGANGESFCEFVPRKGTGSNEFFSTPDIFTSSNFGLTIVMYVEADLRQTVSSSFRTLALSPTAESYARKSEGFVLGYNEDSFDKKEDVESGLGAESIVAIVAACVVVVAAAAFFIVKRRTVVKQAENHIDLQLASA
jgi:hypothetical protein